MTTTTTLYDQRDVLDMVRAFSESGDLRLRANGVQALAALAAGKDRNLAVVAHTHLVNAIVGAPSSSDVSTMIRFRERALAAIRSLGDDLATATLGRLREEHHQSNDRGQQAALGRLLLQAIADGMPWQGSWYELRKIMSSTGAVTLSSVLGVAAAALIVGFLPLLASVFSQTAMAKEDQWWWALPIGWVLLSALMYFTPIGRLRLPTSTRVVEAVLWALVFAFWAIAGAFLFARSEFLASTVGQKIIVVLIGVVVGVAIRSVSWASRSDRYLEVIGAIALTTFACMIAAYCHLNSLLCAGIWLVLAPAAGIAAWATNWVESKGPSARENRRSEMVAMVLIGGLTSLVVIVGGVHLSKIVHPKLSESKLEVSGGAIAQGKIPGVVTVNVSEKDRYTIRVNPSNEDVDVCLNIRIEGKSIAKVDRNDTGQSEEYTGDLPAGEYTIEVMHSDQWRCNPYLLNYVAGLISGKDWAREGTVDVGISRANQRPVGSVPNPSQNRGRK